MNEFNLKDCLDEIIAPLNTNRFLTDDDEIELYNMCMYLMDEFINNFPTVVQDHDFEEIFEENIYELVHSHFYDSIYYTEDAEDEVEDFVSYCIDDFYEFVMPPRSYPTTFIIDEPNVDVMTEKINILRKKPQPPQKTPEWYLSRYNLITASNAYKVFESQAMQNQLIYEKCKPLINDDVGELNNNDTNDTNTKTVHLEQVKMVNTTTTLHWGHKYEPLSVKIYEAKFDTKIEEFGCIKHDKYNFLGASPDGINVKPDNNRYGRALEIKNIVNREIDGIPKKEYWVQMQLQMEVCDLDECDFLETKFIEYENYDDYKSDSVVDIDMDNNEFINLSKSHDGKMKGMLMHFYKKNGSPHYEYMPFDLYDECDIDEWCESVVNNYESLPYNYTFIKTIYWKLEKMSCVLVCRNKLWFNLIVGEIEKIWRTIEYERIHGYSHRQPNRRKSASNTNTSTLASNTNTSTLASNTNTSTLASNTNTSTLASNINTTKTTTIKLNTIQNCFAKQLNTTGGKCLLNLKK
jgi:hypothetical protein